jgi:serpin B
MNKLLGTLLCALAVLPSAAGEESEPFALKAFRTAVQAAPGNVAFSPSSMEGVLRLLRRGAQGETAAELDCAGISPVSPVAGSGVREAEALFVDSSLEPALLPAVRCLDIRALPLQKNPQEAVNIINSWVSGHTRGMIPELFNADSLRGASPMAMVAVNATAMDARWQFPFSPDKTEEQKFYCADGSTPDVQMMMLRRPQYVAHGEDWDAVALFYKGKDDAPSRTCLVAILPTGNARDFVASLTAEKYAEITSALQQFTRRRIVLGLPRFELRTETKSWKSILQACGLRRLFSPQADFRGFMNRPLYVGDICQSCYVKADEQGTRAAAATAAIIVQSAAPRRTERLIFNRPFIWAIMNLDFPQSPFFMGLFENP